MHLIYVLLIDYHAIMYARDYKLCSYLVLVFILTILLWFYEAYQIYQEGLAEYMSDVTNWIDLFG